MSAVGSIRIVLRMPILSRSESDKMSFPDGNFPNSSFIGGGSLNVSALSNSYAFNLIKTDFIPPAIVELRRAGRGMVRHRGGLFERAAVLQVSGDAGCPEAVIAELASDAGCRRAPADHRIGVGLRQHRARQLAGAAPDSPE